MGPGDQGVSRGGGHHGHRPRRYRGHRGHRPGADPHVEGVHQHSRQAGVRQVREREDAGQVGHRRESYFQAGHLNIQKSHLCGEIMTWPKYSMKAVEIQIIHRIDRSDTERHYYCKSTC